MGFSTLFFPMEWSKIYMVICDQILSAQAQSRVDIKQNMFEFRTSFKLKDQD